MQTMSPLHVIYQMLIEETQSPAEELLPSEEYFGFCFNFPQRKRSSHPQFEYNMAITWNEKEKTLEVATVAEGVTFAPWDGMIDFFQELNVAIAPFLEIIPQALGGLTPCCTDENNRQQLLPGHRAMMGCEGANEKEVREAYAAVYESAAVSLLFSRPVFQFIDLEGRAPTALEQLRLLSVGSGLYEVYRKEDEKKKVRCLLPPRLFGGMSALMPQ